MTNTEHLDALLIDKATAAKELLARVEMYGAENPVEALRDLHLAAQTIESAQRTAVQIVRDAGASWAFVGKQLDMSRQAAWEKYGMPPGYRPNPVPKPTGALG